MPTLTTTVTSASASGVTTTVTTTEATPDQGAAAPASITLEYFDGRGLAEVPRMLLALAGVTYEDKRWPIAKDADGKYVKDEYNAAAAAGLAPTNLGRLPTVTMDGVEVGGSRPVYRAIAKRFGFAGTGFAEETLVDSICEIMQDIKAAARAESDKDKWFTGVGTAQGDRQLMWFLQGLEKIVGSSGYAAGSSTTVADVLIFYNLAETCTVSNFGTGESLSEPMGDLARVNDAVAKHAPNVQRICDTVGASLGSYRASRGVSTF